MNERGGDGGAAAGGPQRPRADPSPKANGLNELGHLGPGPGAGRGRDEERKVANEAGLAALGRGASAPGRSERSSSQGGQQPVAAVGDQERDWR